ncbi:hypothetical protein BDP55DRAFT_651897 [Colletotrichum godetiae]|uniref:Secreted protein n=1 Tax=Colletotrichum godetiae TaxID=1209918 RepID=A0AAJ0AW09_9PEZI|nr:uncharacterized protein BDP55DRAFT_651897 [Colletotrichum godetiae]KAK1689885.1 hypothetical protein BDP55DRAFT_651897 [Colletotrichum godetiae]
MFLLVSLFWRFDLAMLIADGKHWCWCFEVFATSRTSHHACLSQRIARATMFRTQKNLLMSKPDSRPIRNETS